MSLSQLLNSKYQWERFKEGIWISVPIGIAALVFSSWGLFNYDVRTALSNWPWGVIIYLITALLTGNWAAYIYRRVN